MKTFLTLERDQKRWILYFVSLVVCYVCGGFSFDLLTLLPFPDTNRNANPLKKEARTMCSDEIQDL